MSQRGLAMYSPNQSWVCILKALSCVLHTSTSYMRMFCLHGARAPPLPTLCLSTCISLYLGCSWATLLIYGSFFLLPLTISSCTDVHATLFNHQLHVQDAGLYATLGGPYGYGDIPACVLFTFQRKKIHELSLYYYNAWAQLYSFHRYKSIS